MIPGEVADADVLGNKFHDLADHFHMRIGPVELAELPDINDISIQHENFRSNTPEIIQTLTGMTDIGSQLHIRYNNYVTVAFIHLPDKTRFDLLTNFQETIKIFISRQK